MADEGADVCVLDEATSDLDAVIERRVRDGIESMAREYAIVAIAHRLSTVREADRIYALEGGTITAANTASCSSATARTPIYTSGSDFGARVGGFSSRLRSFVVARAGS